MPANVRGHHSSINKAVSAHRQMVEDRTTRQSMRQVDPNASSQNFSDSSVMNNVVSDDMSLDGYDDYQEHEIVDPASGPAKQAVVQGFQTSEPGRPSVGEPIPKGSYLDVEA